MKLTKRGVATMMAAALVGAALVVPTAQAAPGCAKPDHPGGDWPTFGLDAGNSRHQANEKEITADTAAMITPQWRFSIASAEADGNFQSTPVVADGCVFAGTNTGWLFALNADTGEIVWKRSLSSDDPYGLAGLSGGVFSLGVGDGRVYANVTALGSPYTIALDQKTGAILWRTIVTKDEGSYTNSSVALIDDMVFIGISGPEDSDRKVRHPGGWALLDAKSGRLIGRWYTINEKDDKRGQQGASLWATPVYDAATGYIFDGTGQPANKDAEHSLTNSILKIDVERRRKTFGKIVDYYKGDYDERVDVDFGGSPTMFRNENGDKLVGELQKSGRFHAVYADTMEQAWWQRLSDPIALGNSATGAYDGKAIYIPATASTDPGRVAIGGGNVPAREPSPGYLYALDPSTGAIKWRVPTGDGVEYHLVTVAGGVVYLVTTHGLLLGFDAENGLPVAARSLSADTAADACANLSSGAIVARNMIYAVCDVGAAGTGWLVAYGL